MINIARTELVLTKIVELLRDAKVSNWAGAFDGFREKLSREPDRVAGEIIATYGGMGSFNDVILYENGQPLVVQNGELDSLREELYSLCRG